MHHHEESKSIICIKKYKKKLNLINMSNAELKLMKIYKEELKKSTQQNK